MSLLREYVSGIPRSQPLLLIQSSIAQSGIPILRHIIAEGSARHCLVFCLLYRACDLIDGNASSDRVRHYDWLNFVPGYSNFYDIKEQILHAVRETQSGKLDVIIDSVDTLLQDDGSPTRVHNFLHTLLRVVRDRPHPSRLVLHVQHSNELVSLLTQVSLSPSLVYLTVHPPALFVHLAKEYLMSPPPSSSEVKFWGVFLPIRERYYETINLVHCPGGEGSGNSAEMVVEVLIRGSNGTSRRHGIPRALEGWSIIGKGPSDLTSLESMNGVWRTVPNEAAPDPTRNISFNLGLTRDQQESRARVPLPYTLESKIVQPTPSAILYEPDSADDIDDDDPDEDLDI